MKVVVIQLCRMGDVVQTLPVLYALTRDGAEIDLVIDAAFRDLPIPTEAAKRVHFYSRGPSSLDPSRWPDRLDELHRLLSPLRAARPDLVVNLSFDEPSSFMTSYIGAGEVRGLTFTRSRAASLGHPWMHYVWSMMAARELGVFNLADIYGYVAGVPLPGRSHRLTLRKQTIDRASALLRGKGLGGRPLLGFVPGASDARKKWPAASFAALGRELVLAGMDVVVLGAPGERKEVESIAAAAGLVPLAGETDLELLAGVASALDLLVTNDTGTMHLAAAVGTPTLVLTSGPAFFRESGPYGENHLVLQPTLSCSPCQFDSFCADTPCRDAVPVKDVLELAHRILSSREGGTAPLDARSDPTYRAYRSTFAEDGRLAFEPCRTYPLDAQELARAAYLDVWAVSLGFRDEPTGAGAKAARLLECWDGSQSAPAASRVREAALAAGRIAEAQTTACSELLALCRSQGAHDDATAISAPIERLVRELELAGQLEPLIRPLTSFSLCQAQFAGTRAPRAALTELLAALSGGADRARLFQSVASNVADAVTRLAGVDFSYVKKKGEVRTGGEVGRKAATEIKTR